MTANIFTKVLPHPAFMKHNLALALIDQSVTLLKKFHFDDPDTQVEHPDGSTGEGRYCLFASAFPDIRALAD